MLHADFFRVSEKKKIVVKVPLHLEGSAVGFRFGGILIQNRTELRLSCYPQDIQDVLKLDISNMEIGDILRIKDVPIPEGSEIVASPQFVVARMEAPRVSGADVEESDGEVADSAEASSEGGDDTAEASD